MFLNFFYLLRQTKIKVTPTELFDFYNYLKQKTKNNGYLSLDQLYFGLRATLVKDVKHYDDFDLIFNMIFNDVKLEDLQVQKDISSWLTANSITKPSLEAMNKAMSLQPNELKKLLQQRLNEQKKRHQGGNHWIGTGGTSAFGNSGWNSHGVRIGGNSTNRSAISVAGERKYRGYRTDATLDVRQIKSALKNLRQLKKTGKRKLSIPATIKKTCDNAGDIEVVLEKSRKNSLNLLLLMDVGGSMTPFSLEVSRLFSAANQMNHFHVFEHFYFHNIFYNYVFCSARMKQRINFNKLIKNRISETRVLIVGDALMAPYELLHKTQREEDFYRYLNDNDNVANEKQFTGLQQLQKLNSRFEKVAWLNPEDKMYWNSPTIELIAQKTYMQPLTIDGIQNVIEFLK